MMFNKSRLIIAILLAFSPALNSIDKSTMAVGAAALGAVGAGGYYAYKNYLNNKKLLSAVAEGSLEDVESALQAGADVNFATREKIGDRLSEAVDSAFNAQRIGGSSPPIFGETALMKAAESGKVEMVNRLLDAGANVNAINRYEYTALMYAVEKGNVDIVRRLLEVPGIDVKNRGSNPDDFRYATALFLAVEKGSVDIVRLLLNHLKAEDLNIFYIEDAARRRNADIVELLLDKGAPVSIDAISHAETKMNRAIGLDEREEYNKIINLLKADLNNRLLRSVLEGSVEGVELALQAGADVNAANDYGDTALILAAGGYAGEEVRAEIVRLLLDAGANVNVANNNGKTALMLATENDRTEIVDMLEKAQQDFGQERLVKPARN